MEEQKPSIRTAITSIGNALNITIASVMDPYCRITTKYGGMLGFCIAYFFVSNASPKVSWQTGTFFVMAGAVLSTTKYVGPCLLPALGLALVHSNVTKLKL